MFFQVTLIFQIFLNFPPLIVELKYIFKKITEYSKCKISSNHSEAYLKNMSFDCFEHCTILSSFSLQPPKVWNYNYLSDTFVFSPNNGMLQMTKMNDLCN